MRRHRAGGPIRLRPADAIAEAFAAIVARPARAVLAGLPITVAVVWFVAGLGLISSANGQVAAVFTGRLATQVRLTQVRPGPSPAAAPFPRDAAGRLDALRGVLAAGVYWQVRPAGPVAGPARGGRLTARPPVIAATPGFLAAAGVRIGQGRRYGGWAQSHAAPVCLLGYSVARELGISSLRGGEPCLVMGIIGSAVRQPALLGSVLLPTSTAAVLFGPPGALPGAHPAMLIRTRPGAALVVARQAPYAVSPARPRQFRVTVPPSPQRLRDQVTSVLGRLFVVVGWVSLAIGVLALAFVTWLSVLERAPEYALRRALGARRRHVAAHVATESAVIGLLSGLAGAGLGVAVVVLVARASHWAPVLAPLTVLAAPPAAAVTGMLAGLAPAIRAGWIQPAWALRRPVAA